MRARHMFSASEMHHDNMIYMLSNNIPSEREIVRRYTVNEFLTILKIRVDEILASKKKSKE